MKTAAIVVLALVTAAPAGAIVTIWVDNPECAVGAIRYQTTGEKVRAFALDITVDSGAIITAVTGFHRGESIGPDRLGYGIFPTAFQRHIYVDPATGQVDQWDVNDYTPVLGPNDIGALGGLGTNGITVELGSLYYPANDNSPNAPPNWGVLFKFAVDKECNAFVSLNAARGGIVLTDPQTVPAIVLEGPLICGTSLVPCCDEKYAEWTSVGRPSCWIATQCHGDADGQTQGSSKTGFTRVGTNDLAILIDAWNIKEPLAGPGIGSIPNGICADFDRLKGGNAKTGFYRVGPSDLNILLKNWLVKEPPAGPGIPPDCNPIPADYHGPTWIGCSK